MQKQKRRLLRLAPKDAMKKEAFMAAKKKTTKAKKVPPITLKILGTNDTKILAMIGKKGPIEIAFEYSNFYHERVYTRGAFNDGDGSETKFIDRCEEVGLPKELMRRLRCTMIEALFISGMATNEESRGKTLDTIRYMWEHPERWDIDRQRWAGLIPPTAESRYR